MMYLILMASLTLQYEIIYFHYNSLCKAFPSMQEVYVCMPFGGGCEGESTFSLNN